MANGAGFSSHDAILQENYGDVHEILQLATVLINKLPTSNKRPDGRQFRESITMAVPSGFGYFGSKMATTPDAETSVHEEAIMQQAYGAGALEIDWVLMEHNTGHSYLNALDEQMRGFTKFQGELNERYAASDGTGRLGYDSSGQLDSAHMRGRVDRQANDASGRLVVRMYGSHNSVWFRDNEHVEFMYDPTGTAASPAAFNTWEKRDTPAQGYFRVHSVTVNQSASAADDYIEITMKEPPVAAGNDPGEDETTKYDVIIADEAIELNTSLGGLNLTKIPYGVDALISNSDAPMQMEVPITSMRLADASMHGISSAQQQWQSAVADGSGGYFSLGLAHQLSDEISRKSAADASGIRFIFMDDFQARQYESSLHAQGRYPITGAAGEYRSGSTNMFNKEKAARIAEKEVCTSRFQLRDRVHFVGKGLRQYTLKKFGWVNVGGIWHRAHNDSPKNRAVATGYTNCGITDRTASGVMTGLRTL